MTLGLEVAQPANGGWAHVRVVDNDNGASASAAPRNNLHLVFVVDVSGSMGSTVESQDASGNKENHGFSILDLVKHALLTLVHSLSEAHQVTLITFTDVMRVEFSELVMTEAGKDTATEQIKALTPQRTTNLWAGLKKAYDLVQDFCGRCPGFFNEILLFTDGMPNMAPPRGHIPQLQHYLQKVREDKEHAEQSRHFFRSHAVRTYGFGYSLDSQLLQEIAVIGRGTFSFIPDAGFVGTIFIHALADMLTASCHRVRNAHLVLGQGERKGQPNNQVIGLDSHKQLGHEKSVRTHGGRKTPVVSIPLGTLAVGQSRDFLVRNADLSTVFRLEFDEYKEKKEVVPVGKPCTAGADAESVPVVDNDLQDDFDGLSMVSDFVSFNLKHQVGKGGDQDQESVAAGVSKESAAKSPTAAGGLQKRNSCAWCPVVLEGREAVLRSQAHPRDVVLAAKPHFCRLQLCDIVAHCVDSPQLSLAQKQRLVADFISKCARTTAENHASQAPATAIAADASGPCTAADAAESFVHVDDLETLASFPLTNGTGEPASEPQNGADAISALLAAGPPGTEQKVNADAQSDGSEENSTLASTAQLLTKDLFEGCLEDLKGQVTEALSREDWFGRWGIFYLRSLCMAHQLQKRNNFKDFGVQHYGGAAFDKEVDRINDVFDNLEPPEPSNKHHYGGAPVAHVHSMAVYNNCYGGCFLPDCVADVVVVEGNNNGIRQVRCDQLKRGDVVRTSTGRTAKILCVVKIVGTRMRVVKFRDTGLGITPWHPMLVDTAGSGIKGEKEWVFPAEHAATLPEDATEAVVTPVVYNFLLEANQVGDNQQPVVEKEETFESLVARTGALADHTMLVNGVPAVTFGHGLETNAVVRHEYWGNMRKILRDVRLMHGWADGQVLLKSETACVKDPRTNLVVKLVQTIVGSGSSTGVSVPLHGDEMPRPPVCVLEGNNANKNSTPPPASSSAADEELSDGTSLAQARECLIPAWANSLGGHGSALLVGSQRPRPGDVPDTAASYSAACGCRESLHG
jgi:hypothetical protein